MCPDGRQYRTRLTACPRRFLFHRGKLHSSVSRRNRIRKQKLRSQIRYYFTINPSFCQGRLTNFKRFDGLNKGRQIGYIFMWIFALSTSGQQQRVSARCTRGRACQRGTAGVPLAGGISRWRFWGCIFPQVHYL